MRGSFFVFHKKHKIKQIKCSKISKDRYTLNPLYMTGFQLAPAQKKALDSILRQYGVTLNGNALETKSSIETFAQRKHLFLQAIMRVDAFLSDVCLMT